jgi:hypothetical protein
MPIGVTSITNNRVAVSFSLYAPALSYHFPFLRIKFGIEPMYPVAVVADKMDEAFANDESELTTLLGKIFNAPSTVATIERLMALAKA